MLYTEHAFKDETRLALYALEQQAIHGPCKDSKPWGWNVIESAKWQGWSQLGDMASVEAMRLFVRLLEDEKVSPSSSMSCWCCYQGLQKQVTTCTISPNAYMDM